MTSKLKGIAIAVIVAALGYVVMFKTNLIVSRMRDFPSWVTRFKRIEAGTYEPTGIIHTEYVEELRDSYLAHLAEDRVNLLFGAGGDALQRARSDKLVWRRESELFVTNLGPITGLPSTFEPEMWTKHLRAYLFGEPLDIRQEELVFVAFAASNFDSMTFVNQFGDQPRGTATTINIKQLRNEARKR